MSHGNLKVAMALVFAVLVSVGETHTRNYRRSGKKHRLIVETRDATHWCCLSRGSGRKHRLIFIEGLAKEWHVLFVRGRPSASRRRYINCTPKLTLKAKDYVRQRQGQCEGSAPIISKGLSQERACPKHFEGHVPRAGLSQEF